ncbi:MAG: c(7)-type cytochrome triheme domain-containing protein [Desulfobulbus sp.]|jgi:c(7)-type cytochrome triheme protein
MNSRRKTISTLGTVLVAGFFCFCGVQASATEQTPEAAPAQQPADTEQVLASYGDTQVIAINPIKRVFRHEEHVIGAKLSCDACHPNLFQRKYGALKTKGEYRHTFFDKGQYCGTCHNGTPTFATTGADNCKRCHGSDMKQPNIIVFTKPVKAVAFSHKGHVDMGLSCSSCHDSAFEMRVGAAEEQPDTFIMQTLYAGKSCGVCHNGMDAFASNTRCTLCHVGVKGMDRQAAPSEEPAATEPEPVAEKAAAAESEPAAKEPAAESEPAVEENEAVVDSAEPEETADGAVTSEEKTAPGDDGAADKEQEAEKE